MAQTYYNVDKAAEVLGVSSDEVKQMRERGELYGYRDGSTWKFKAEDVSRLAAERAGTSPSTEAEGDVLLSDIELGSSPGASASVIGRDQPASASRTGGSRLVGSKPADSAARKAGSSDLVTDDDLLLEGSSVPPSKPQSKTPAKGKPKAPVAGDSAVDLGSQGGRGDDDLVLGGSSSGGSDVSIGGDSGISLVDPADSGLSLEEPLELSAGGDESLELGEEDMLGTVEESPSHAAADLKTDDDFLLTPMPEAADEEDSSSGSQVIALDTEGGGVGGEGATMVGGPATASMVAMLDEDMSTAAPLGTLAGAAPSMMPDQLGAQAAELAAAPALPEAPYSVWNILGLTVCVLLLLVTGSMMFDLLRNMWSWDQAWSVNSKTMDWVIGLFEK